MRNDFRTALSMPPTALTDEQLGMVPEQVPPQELGQVPAGLAGIGAPPPAAPVSPFELYVPPAPPAAAPPAPMGPSGGDLTRGYSFTADEVSGLAKQQGTTPEKMRAALESAGATILAPARPQSRAAAPGAGLRGAVGSAGGGGAKGLIATEIAKREAAAAQAANAYGQASEKLKTATDGLVGAQQQGLEIEAAGLEQVAKAQEGARANIARMQQMDAEKRRQEDEAVALQQAELDRGWTEYRDATVEDRRSPGEKTMAIFGIALSGIADALLMSQGQRGNFQQNAMAAVDAQIQRRVDKQLEALNRKRENLTTRERALQNFRARVGDDRAFRSLLAQKEWEDVGLLAEQVGTRSQSQQKRNAAVELKAAADAAAAQHGAAGTAAALQTAQDRVVKAQDQVFEMSLKAAQGTGQKKPTASGYGLRVIDPNKPPSERDTEKAQEIYQKSGGLFQVFDELDALAAKGSTMSSDERTYAGTLIDALGPTWSNTLGSGAPSEVQLKSSKENFLNPTEVNIADSKRFYGRMRALAKNLANRQMRPYNHTIDDIDVRPE